MKANYYNHMNRMNRSNTASTQIRRTVRINRNRMELKPDEPPDIRRVLEQLNQQIHDHAEPEAPIMTVSQLYASKMNPTSGTYAITSQEDMDALVLYSKAGRNTKGVTFTILDPKETYTVEEVLYPVRLKQDNYTNSPIPTGTGFEGTLDGKGATINLAIGGTAAPEAPADGDTTLNSVGLFGAIGVNGKVENLTLTGTVKAGAEAGAVGALVGYNSGIINNVTVNSRATIEAPNSYNVGGIAGFNDAFYVADARGTIRNSVNNGSVTGYEKVGGICGENSGLIGSCSNSGEVRAESIRRSGTGGIAGRNGNNNTALETGKIFDCYNTGAITGGTGTSVKEDKNLGQWVGGIAGFQNSLSICGYCYNTGELLGYGRVHCIIGENDNTATEENEEHVIIYKGIVNCYSQLELVTSATDQDEEFGVKYLQDDQMNGNAVIEDGLYLVDLLNEGNEAVEYWKQSNSENDGYPTLTGKYDDALNGEDVTGRPGFTTVYLDDYDGEKIPGNGEDSEHPFHNLADAVEAAGAGGKVILTKPITINQATGLYDSVTFERGFALTTEDPNNDGNPENNSMFILDIENVTENNAAALGYLTMTTAIIDGDGGGFLFYVKHGRLRLRGNITLMNCETAVYVKGSQGTAENPLNAQVEVNYATIKETDTAIKLINANSDFILDAFNEVSIQGTIYLGTGSYITVAAPIPCELAVKCKVYDLGTLIAKGTENTASTKKYALTDEDCRLIKIAEGGLFLEEADNEIIIF